jgi:hypothetical protein
MALEMIVIYQQKALAPGHSPWKETELRRPQRLKCMPSHIAQAHLCYAFQAACLYRRQGAPVETLRPLPRLAFAPHPRPREAT